MSKLGTMLLRAGLLSDGQVADADEHARVKQLAHVDAVLELGLADEDTLVAFLASKLMIPRVRQAVLERIDVRTGERLRGDLAWRHLTIPVSVDELGNLTVAMADPTDEAAVEAIARHSNRYLIRAVAATSNVRRTLIRLYGSEQEANQRAAQRAAAEHRSTAELTLRSTDVSMTALDPAGALDSAPVEPVVQYPSDDELDAYSVEHTQGDPEETIPTHVDIRSPSRVARREPPTPAPVIDPRPLDEEERRMDERRITAVQTEAPGPRRPRARAHTPWNPPLATPPPAPLSPEAVAGILPKFEASTDRDQITKLLMDFLAEGFGRVILFVHNHNELRGHDARGEDLMVEAVRQVRIPSTGKSVFADVIERGRPYLGPMRDSKIDVAFASALGGLKGNVLVLPIVIGRKCPILVFAHGTTHSVDPGSIAELSAAVSAAIQRLIASIRRG